MAQILITKAEREEMVRFLALAGSEGRLRLTDALSPTGVKVPVIAIEVIEEEGGQKVAALLPVAILITDTEQVRFGRRRGGSRLSVVVGDKVITPK